MLLSMRTPCKYQMGRNVILEFSRRAALTLYSHQQINDRKEAGGILIGRVWPDSRVLIEVATVPNGFDEAGRYSFNRSREAAQQIINRAWEESMGEQIYLGEWHSHPEEDPWPSSRDRQMIRTMFRETRMEIRFLILIVVGTHRNWVGLENGRALTQLKSA
jgi:integrative and conjugative element protein (TIGR02256 family)